MDFTLNEKQKMLQSMVRDFTRKDVEPRWQEMEDSRRIPDDLLKKLASLGLFGMTVPLEYNGSDAGGFAHLLAIEQLAYSGTPAWWPVAFNNSLPEIICKFGTPEQKKRFVSNMFDGAKCFSVQFTEPDTGSDSRALKTTARPDGDYYIINGQKRFSTFGARNGTAIVWTRDEEGGCTAFLVDKNCPGYTAPKTWELMGTGGIEAADIDYNDVRVHKDQLLHKKGKGFEALLYWIAIEKVEGCIVATALAQSALDEAVKYTKTRIVNGKPMSDMQGIRFELADLSARIQACRWLTYRTAMLHDTDDPAFQTEAAACKLFVQPVVNEVIATALRLHGAYGYTTDFKIERLYRAQPGNVVISVSLEINKAIVGASLVK
ncbi:MAG: acyl-CoA dehydrogenase family protein [Dehalococcoidales bacterium]